MTPSIATVATLTAAFLIMAGCSGSRVPIPGAYVSACGEEGIVNPDIVVTLISPGSSELFDLEAISDSLEYPDFYRRAFIEGETSATIFVSPSGRADSVTVTSSSLEGPPGAAFAQATREGLMSAIYSPAPGANVSVQAEVRWRLDVEKIGWSGMCARMPHNLPLRPTARPAVAP